MLDPAECVSSCPGDGLATLTLQPVELVNHDNRHNESNDVRVEYAGPIDRLEREISFEEHVGVRHYKQRGSRLPVRDVRVRRLEQLIESSTLSITLTRDSLDDAR